MSEFLKALKRENSKHIPVWFMRQAGRYLPEYMAIKKESSFRKMSHTPHIMKEITLQPMKRYPLDAAIMFSDILTCLEFMGAPFEFTDHGPKLQNKGVDTLLKLSQLNPSKDLSFVGEGIQLIKKELTDKPLIGFVGAPFTLISYLIEGGTSKEFLETKQFMLSRNKDFHNSMNHLVLDIGNYLDYQVYSGVQAVQIFDSWVGVLSSQQYEEFILPHMKDLINKFKKKNPNIPIILYSQPTTHLLKLLSKTGADALSVDWRSSISDVIQSLPEDIAIQGNLDPVITTLNWEKAKDPVIHILNQVKECKALNRFIFNVGHGVTPFTNTETIAKIIDCVHSYNDERLN